MKEKMLTKKNILDEEISQKEEVDEEENICEVEKIVKKRRRQGKTEYLIKWKEDPDQSWIDSEDILDDSLIEDFENSKSMATPQKKRGRKKKSSSSTSSKSSEDSSKSLKRTPRKSPKKIDPEWEKKREMEIQKLKEYYQDIDKNETIEVQKDLFQMNVESDVVVIDLGTSLIKLGISGEDAPTAVIKNQKTNGELSRTMKNGIVENKDLLEDILLEQFISYVKPSETSFFITENPMRDSDNRKIISEIFYEKFNAPYLSFEITSPLTLYAIAKTTSLVVDCGEGVTSVVPIYDGIMMEHAMNVIDKGLFDLKENIFKTLNKYNSQKLDFEISEKIFDNFCTNIKYENINEKYILPDGIEIPKNIEGMASNFYFEELGLHQEILQSLHLCDIDIKINLRENLILTGGGTFISNFKNDLYSKLETEKFIPIYYPERLYLNWIGASVLTQLSSFEKNWISLSEYLEFGSWVLHEK
eukprot:gene9031-1129_t